MLTEKRINYLASTLLATLCFAMMVSSPTLAATTNTTTTTTKTKTDTTTTTKTETAEITKQTLPWWLHPVITVSGGIATTHVGQSQTLRMEGDFTTYQYTRSGDHSTRKIFGGFIGTEVPLFPKWTLQTGLGFYQPSSFSSGNGNLIQGINVPSSNQFPYHYKVKSRQLLVEWKLLWSVRERFHPYASLGIGAAFNRTYAYTADLPPFFTFTPQFTAHTNTSLSTSFGVGIDVDIHKKWRLGAGYRFTDLGKGNLGLGLIDTTPFASALAQSHLYTNEFMAHLTYLIF